MVQEIASIVQEYDSKNATIVFSGHSLGAALATLGFANSILNTNTPSNYILYTFASPRVFNTNGANFVGTYKNTIQRIFNTEDIVPTLPSAISGKYIYTHTGQNYPFTLNLGTVILNHTTSYTQYLSTL